MSLVYNNEYMYPFFILIMMTWMGFLSVLMSSNAFDLAQKYEYDNRTYDQKQIISRVKGHYENNVAHYGDYQEIVNNNEDLKYKSHHIEYETSNEISADEWSFDRSIVYSKDPYNGDTLINFLKATNNDCGDQDFWNAKYWCPKRSNNNWWLLETREFYIQDIREQHVFLESLLRKFINYFNAHQEFPTSKSGGGEIVVGEQIRLLDAVGYTGSADDCNDEVFLFDGLPLSCDDLFNSHGEPTVYNYNNPLLIYLFTKTIAKAEDGKPIYASQGLSTEE